MKKKSILIIITALHINNIFSAEHNKDLFIDEFVDSFIHLMDDDDFDILEQLKSDLNKLPDELKTLENIRLLIIYFCVIDFNLSTHINYVLGIEDTLFHLKRLKGKIYSDEWIDNAKTLTSLISSLEGKNNFTFYLMENVKSIPDIEADILDFINKLLIGISDDDKIEFLKKLIHNPSSIIKLKQLKNEILSTIHFTSEFSLINSKSIYTKNFIENIEKDLKENFLLLQQAYQQKNESYRQLLQLDIAPSRSVVDLIFSDESFNAEIPLRLGRKDVKDDEIINNDKGVSNFIVLGGGFMLGKVTGKYSIGGKPIDDYFTQLGRPNDNSYKYLIYSDKTHQIKGSNKGIIIEYYGGNTARSGKTQKSIKEIEKQIIQSGYTYIDLHTLDSEKNIEQYDQFQTSEGRQLLGDTLVQFFLFTKALKKRNPKQPIYYTGASFGGTKGILINFILSNIGHLDEIFTEEFKFLADILNPILEPQDIHLIDGYIFHDGWYEPFFDKRLHIPIRENHFKIKKPVLLLQNFDDETVQMMNIITLYNLLRSSDTYMNLVHLFITPMAASKNIQAIKDEEKMSSDGHHKPINKKYFEEYKNKIFSFLDTPSLNTYSHERFQHAQKLTKAFHEEISFSSRSLQYVEKEKDRTVLYRIYFALIHQEDDKKPLSKTDRIIKTFVEYATYLEDNPLSIKEKALELFSEHGLWLIYQTLLKQKTFVKSIHKQYLSK